MAEIRTATRLNPHFPRYYLNLRGRVLYSMGKFDEALEPLERGVTAMPNNSSVHLLLAANYVELGRLPEARAMVAKALAVNPEYRLGEVHYSAPYAEQSKLARYLESLKTAGMPE